MSTQLTDNPGLDFHFDCKPDFSYLTVQIPEGETLKVEASAMATMDTIKLFGGEPAKGRIARR